MKTIQSTTMNFMLLLEVNPDCKKKLLDEIMPAIEKVKDNIVDGFEYETVMDFDYIGKVMYEILRVDPPVPITAAATMI